MSSPPGEPPRCCACGTRLGAVGLPVETGYDACSSVCADMWRAWNRPARAEAPEGLTLEKRVASLEAWRGRLVEAGRQNQGLVCCSMDCRDKQFPPAARPPARSLPRVQAIADELFENVQAGQQAERRIVEFGERVVRMYGTRLLQLIDGPAVDALKRTLEQAEREFLGPKGVR